MKPRLSWTTGVAGGGAGLLAVLGYQLSRPAPPQPQPRVRVQAVTRSFAATPPVHPDSDSLPVLPDAKPDSAGGCRPEPLRFVSPPGLGRPLLVGRYVGTIGGQPAQALLQWYRPDSLQGRFFLRRGGPEYELNLGKPLSGGRLSVEPTYPFDTTDQGYWQLSGRPGPVLRGHWQQDGRRQVIELRENYAGALRYRVETLLLTGGPPEDGEDGRSCHVPTFRRDFLTPLEPGKVAPGLRAALFTTDAARRRMMREGREADATVSQWPDVRLNEAGLLSFQTIHYADPFGGKPQHGTQSALYDLRTGQELTIASQLQPGYEHPLRQLITTHLLHDPGFNQAITEDPEWSRRDEQGRLSTLAPLPDPQPNSFYSFEYLALTGAGLEARYSPSSLFEAGSGEPPLTLVVPYHELLPLIRPGSALDRMLKARGR